MGWVPRCRVIGTSSCVSAALTGSGPRRAPASERVHFLTGTDLVGFDALERTCADGLQRDGGEVVATALDDAAEVPSAGSRRHEVHAQQVASERLEDLLVPLRPRSETVAANLGQGFIRVLAEQQVSRHTSPPCDSRHENKLISADQPTRMSESTAAPSAAF